MGRLVRDPEIKYVGDSGTPMALYTVVVNVYDKNAPNSEKGLFLDCVHFGKTGEWLVRDAKKGDLVVVAGDLDQDNWTDRDTGKARSKMKIRVSDAQTIRSGGSKMSESAGHPPPAGEPDDIPF